MQHSQDFTDIINDQSKNFSNIFQPDEEDINNVLQTYLLDTQYFTKTDYMNLITTKKLTDQTSLKVISLNIANLVVMCKN